MKPGVVFAIVLSLCATGARAGDHNSCEHAPSGTDCMPVYACIGDQGSFFAGLALGTEGGMLKGALGSGATCTGRWDSLDASQPGRLRMTCNDGTFLQVFYTDTNERTATAIGQGLTSDGKFVTAWTGQKMRKFFSQDNGWPENTLVCGSNTVPLG